MSKLKLLKGFNSKLPTKICYECKRPFQYRKKWKEVWLEVKFCSDRCRNVSKKKVDNKSN